MPIYEYECKNGHRFEAIQKISDDPLTKCKECDAEASRIMSGAGFVLKGEGFSTTDYPSEARKKAHKEAVKSKFEADLKQSHGKVKPQVG
jgi:putative FmdB family regulatory protein